MNAMTVFEERKEEFLAQLNAAPDAASRIAAAELVLEQIACVLAQEEQDSMGRQRQQAVLALSRRAPSLLRAAGAQGELVVCAGERKAKAAKAKLTAKSAGAAILAVLAAVELIDGRLVFALLQLAGCALLMLGAGPLPALFGQMGRAQARGVLEVDSDELMVRLSEICRAADTCVGDLELIEKEAGLSRLSGTADEATIDLLLAMLEAKASGRPEAAVRTLDLAEQYLRMLGVETVSFSEERAQVFDVLPTIGAERTIRPALFKDGKLIRRGVAARQMERSVGA